MRISLSVVALLLGLAARGWGAVYTGNIEGDLVNATGYAVVGATTSVAVTTMTANVFVGVATATVVQRGGRPTLYVYSLDIVDNSGGARSVTCKLAENSVVLQASQRITAQASVPQFTTLSSNIFVTSVAGNLDLALLCTASGTLTTIGNVHVYSFEF